MPSEKRVEIENSTDEELILSFQNGDEKAYNEIVRRYKDRLTNFIYRYAGSLDECEDIVQDTLVKVYISKDLYKEIAKFSTWIYTIAINLAKTRAIKKQKHKIFSLSSVFTDDEKDFDIEDASMQTDLDVSSSIQEVHIQKALNSIPDSYRKLVILRDVEDFSYEEISEMTGLPMGTVKSRINRGRERLQKLLKNIYKE
jgi:RNA polymerase sigma-70 factor (ECF subfamily)